MPIQLDKIVADISDEIALYPNNNEASKKDVEEAWERVSQKNKLSSYEARSIFKVIQKKYEEERVKVTSSWKLFKMMDKLHKKPKEEIKQEIKDEIAANTDLDDDEQYEMLELNDEFLEDSGNMTSLPSSDVKESVADKFEDNKPNIKPEALSGGVSGGSNNKTIAREEKKVLNIMARTNTPQSAATAVAAALVKKGITLKKANSSSSTTNTPKTYGCGQSGVTGKSTNAKTILLPESLKRKLNEEYSSAASSKKPTLSSSGTNSNNSSSTSSGSNSSNTNLKPLNIGSAAATGSSSTLAGNGSNSIHTTTTQLMQVKQEREDELAAQNAAAAVHGINLITIPSSAQLVNGLMNGLVGGTSSTAATVASNSTNGGGFSPRIEDIDFRNDVIFDSAAELNGGNNGTNSALCRSNRLNTQVDNIISMDSLDNAAMPANFLKNLCNPERHEALGIYVANFMNRLRPRAAAKLETRILRAIIDTQSEELEQ